VEALAAADDGGEEPHGLPLVSGKQRVRHLVHRGGGDGSVTVGAVLDAQPRPEQPQQVVHLGGGAHGGAGSGAGGALVHGDRGGEALDEVRVGALHLLQELAGVGGEALDVAALSLGEKGVEGQRRLARPGDAGDHRQLAVRDIEIDVAQVVRASATNANGPEPGRGHGAPSNHDGG
jgi:hypothetical protein